MRLELCAIALLAVVTSASAQLKTPDPDWKELAVPPPPAVRSDGLIPLEMPGSSLRFGVDPQSIGIGSDGVVRYVVVATSGSGAVNAMYEGLQCERGEFRTYARYSPEGGWRSVDGEWQTLRDSGSRGRHALEIARNGACIARAPNTSAEQIVRDLKASPGNKFRNELR